MPNIMLHDDEARMALGRGVAKLAKAVRGTLGPRGMNAIIDRPIGTPIISRDGVSIANEIELEDPFENIGAQVLREVSKQTNEVAGDGTTTATVLADALVQDGLASLVAGANPVELVQGLEIAVQEGIAALRRAATPLRGGKEGRAVAVVAANDEVTGAIVAAALERVGPDGIVDVEFGTTVDTRLEVGGGGRWAPPRSGAPARWWPKRSSGWGPMASSMSNSARRSKPVSKWSTGWRSIAATSRTIWSRTSRECRWCWTTR